jgi:hypothetical protein
VFRNPLLAEVTASFAGYDGSGLLEKPLPLERTSLMRMYSSGQSCKPNPRLPRIYGGAVIAKLVKDADGFPKLTLQCDGLMEHSPRGFKPSL